MSRPSLAHLERARRLLAYEHADSSPDGATTAAGRVFDKLHAQLAPLVGDAGLQSLFVRSAKLVQGDFARFADVSILDGSTKLRECLRARDPGVSAESVVELFGTFLALITTFIGERLTTQVLRNAWPMIEETAPRETPK